MFVKFSISRQWNISSILTVSSPLSDLMYEIKLVRAYTVLRLNQKHNIGYTYNMLTLNY